LSYLLGSFYFHAKVKYKNQKPILGICGAIVLIPKSLEDIAKNLKIAISNNAFNELLSKLNVNVTECAADEIVVDKINKVITTPAFLASQNMNVIYAGIEKMINETNNFC
jgi:enhancing lycopene biosynthesis protein 2